MQQKQLPENNLSNWNLSKFFFDFANDDFDDGKQNISILQVSCFIHNGFTLYLDFKNATERLMKNQNDDLNEICE